MQVIDSDPSIILGFTIMPWRGSHPDEAKAHSILLLRTTRFKVDGSDVKLSSIKKYPPLSSTYLFLVNYIKIRPAEILANSTCNLEVLKEKYDIFLELNGEIPVDILIIPLEQNTIRWYFYSKG